MEMLVWQLREMGAKLAREALDGPHRGWLRVGSLNVDGEVTLHAGLYASRSEGAPPLLHGLSHVQLRRVDHRGMLLIGRQYDPYHPHPRPTYPQAWFCQPA